MEDYVTCRRHAPDGATFVASGVTLQGGGLQSNIEPRFVHFGENSLAPQMSELTFATGVINLLERF